jgi:uncharacterized membrane protein
VSSADDGFVGRRLLAIDWMRGFVMLLMAVDHASETWNGGRFNFDSAYLLDPDTGASLARTALAIPPFEFFTRWITHLCAPTFLFLSGTALALSVEGRARRGEPPAALDRHLFVRAVVILGFEGLISSMAGLVFLQVLFAIGVSLIAMIPLRRLPTCWLFAAALGWMAVGELATRAVAPIGGEVPTLGWALFVAPDFEGGVTVWYPFVHWLAMMVLGWGFGRMLLDLPAGEVGRRTAERWLLWGGSVALAVFVVVRGLDAYGNMGLHRGGDSLVHWLLVSKYPPALAFTALELGLMALAMGGLAVIERKSAGPPWHWNPLLVFGQTALFFYVLHFVLLGAGAVAITGGMRQGGLVETYLAAGAVLVVLYPVCCAYRAYKRAHPKSLAQYL